MHFRLNQFSLKEPMLVVKDRMHKRTQGFRGHFIAEENISHFNKLSKNEKKLLYIITK